MCTGRAQTYDRAVLINLVMKDKKSKRMSSAKLAHEYHMATGKRIPPRTARDLRQKLMLGMAERAKPALPAETMKARLQHCRMLRSKRLYDPFKCMFTDEKWFCASKTSGKVWCMDKDDPDVYTNKKQHDIKVMFFWGDMCVRYPSSDPH